MNLTATALSRTPLRQRLRRRRAQRGMAVFLVVLVMTMVTAIGVFSMRSASLVDRATGYHRQSVQSTAMVEFGVRGAATWLSPNRFEIENAKKDEVPLRHPNCAPALVAANANAECWVIQSERLLTQFETSAPVLPSDGLVGQLSSPFESSVLRAEVTTEVTETFKASAAARPGFTGGELKEITLTTQARIYPTDASTLTTCQAASRGAISQQRVRTHALVQF